MSLIRNLSSIGKEKFVTYFYEFRDLSKEGVINLFNELNLSPDGTLRRYSAFQQIINNDRLKEALELVICNSPRLSKTNPEIIDKARKIYNELFSGEPSCN